MRFSTVQIVAIASVTVLVVVIACCLKTKPVVGSADLAGSADAEARSVRTCAKLLLAHEVAASRRTLWEAAALFGTLDRQPPAPESVIELSPSIPEAEHQCREVIALVAYLLAEHPTKRAAAIAELEAKLNQARNQPGGARLSEPSAELVGETSHSCP
jgi:hypothetical protein